MKAIMIDRYGGPEVLRLGEAPVPAPGSGQLAIRVAAIGVNPADFKWRAGMFAEIAPFAFPHVLGYDVAGVVDAIGVGVGRFAVGDRVVTALDPFRQGGYAEIALADAADVASVPHALSFDVAAALATPGLTGEQLVAEALGVRAGHRLLVTGAAGAVGRFAVREAKRRGAHVVAAVRASQRAEALAIGADEVASFEDGPTGERYDRIADTVGGAVVVPLCRHLATKGSICTVSTTPIPPDNLAPVTFFSVQADARRLGRIARDAAEDPCIVSIAQRLPLADAAEAHRLIEAGGVGGRLILIP